MGRGDRDRLTALGVARDAWRTARAGRRAIAVQQERRLADLVAHARGASRFYAEHYRGLPAGPLPLGGLPPVTKTALMQRFDDWVTDPAVTRDAVEAFVAEPGTIGSDFLGRHVVFTTSGSTGVPALLVQDARSIAVMTGLVYVRSAPMLTPTLLGRTLLRGARQAAVFAVGGHFLSTTMFERRMRARPFRRRIARLFSVLDPMPRLVDELNSFRPTFLGTYASALAALTEEQERGRLRINPLVITSGGELLLPAARRRAEAVFGCPVLMADRDRAALRLR